MQVILLERVENLGQMGDEVTVKNGYARNYLLPQKKALRATKANRDYFKTQKKEIEARNLEARKEAEQVAKTLKGKQIVLVRQAGEAGQLYGSVAARDIVLNLADEGLHVQRGQVRLDKPIKEIGIYDVKIRLHAEVATTIKVNVARSEEEAEVQQDRIAQQAEAVFESEEVREAAEDSLRVPAEAEKAGEALAPEGKAEEAAAANVAKAREGDPAALAEKAEAEAEQAGKAKTGTKTEAEDLGEDEAKSTAKTRAAKDKKAKSKK